MGTCIPRMLLLLPPHKLLVSWLLGLARGSCQWMQVGAAAAFMVPTASQLIKLSGTLRDPQFSQFRLPAASHP